MQRESYVVRNEYGTDLRKGKIVENNNGLFYFLSDYNKAKATDSIPLYNKGIGKLELLRFVRYRTKKHIDTPFN